MPKWGCTSGDLLIINYSTVVRSTVKSTEISQTHASSHSSISDLIVVLHEKSVWTLPTKKNTCNKIQSSSGLACQPHPPVHMCITIRQEQRGIQQGSP